MKTPRSLTVFGTSLPLFALVLAGCPGSSAQQRPPGAPAAAEEPATFVMVHSAWLGGWSWEPVASLLEARGHTVLALDLPGHGANRMPPAEVTMDGYLETVTDALDGLRNRAILVGHSLGGIVISQAAELRPDKVRSLVYLCAFLLPDGASFLAATEGVQGSMVLDNLVMADDGSYVTIRDDVLHEAFAHDVPPDAFESVRPLIVPQPTAPLAAPLSLTEERWGRIPRYYVECTADRAIPLEVQRAMYTAIGVERVFSLEASHAPNFSKPRELAAYLHAVAAR